MLKAIVNYSKKVPAETEYSSQGYSLSLETEITPGDASSIQAQLHDAFELVKASVDHELATAGAGTGSDGTNVTHVTNVTGSASVSRSNGAGGNRTPVPSRNADSRPDRKASNKQVGYINSLASNNGIPLSELLAEIQRRFNAASLYDLTSHEASQIIDEMNKVGRRQRAA